MTFLCPKLKDIVNIVHKLAIARVFKQHSRVLLWNISDVCGEAVVHKWWTKTDFERDRYIDMWTCGDIIM